MFRTLLVSAFLCFVATTSAFSEDDLKMIVMDPLAAPLSCPCVKGYAQRDYTKLGEYLSRKLGKPVTVEFAESLGKGLEKTGGRADIVIGKQSVILADAMAHGKDLINVASLTAKDGSTTQYGLVVVRGDDPATKISELKDYEIILGPIECDEKNLAARDLFEKNGITLADEVPISDACSDGASAVVEAGENGKKATVISSYAQPLLEGCGTIKKGDLKVVGETEKVPFVVASVSKELAESGVVTSALHEVSRHPLLLIALESKAGFVKPTSDEVGVDSKKN